MPSPTELRELLGEVLRVQPDRPDRPDQQESPSDDSAWLHDEQRLRDAISGARTLNERDRLQLLRSPRARARWVEVANQMRAETRARWEQAEIVTRIAYQAAADSEVRPISVDSNPDFSVSLLPLDADGQRWTVSLRVSRRLVETLPGPLRLMDSGGGLWLRGQPDSDGEVSADWSLPESPAQRLRRFELTLEPL